MLFINSKKRKRGMSAGCNYFLVDSDQYSSITGNAKEVRSG